MKTLSTPWRHLFILLAALLIGGCGDSGNDDNTATLSGTVATGAALANATVEVVDANGVIVTTTADANGDYEVEVDADAAPYFIKATSSDGTTTLYSWAEEGDLDGIVNVTDLTTVAVLDAGGEGAGFADGEDLFDNWADVHDDITAEEIAAAEANVKANFSELFADSGVSDDFDIFNDGFETDGEGIDDVLDTILVEITCDADGVCEGSFAVDEGGDGIFEDNENFDFDFDAVSGIE
jgi:hypothetical protein